MEGIEEKKKIMQQAIELAKQNVEENQGGPFGALVVKDGQIIGRGMNKVTSTHDPTAHAEIVAIREATAKLGTFNLEGCEIFTSCEPCPMCLGAIYWSRIDKIYYAGTKNDAAKAGFDDSMIYNEFCLPKEQRSIPFTQLMRDDSVKVFEKWIASENKIPY